MSFFRSENWIENDSAKALFKSKILVKKDCIFDTVTIKSLLNGSIDNCVYVSLELLGLSGKSLLFLEKICMIKCRIKHTVYEKIPIHTVLNPFTAMHFSLCNLYSQTNLTFLFYYFFW